MDPFQALNERIKNRPLTVIMNDGAHISVLILYTSEEANVTGSIRQIWRNDGIIGSRSTLPIAHQTKDSEVLRELTMTIPAPVELFLDNDILVIVADQEMLWTVVTDHAQLTQHLPYVVLTLGMLFTNPGNTGAARIWSTLVTDKIWSMLRA